MSETRREGGDLIGGMLLGRYRVVRELAKGGMGIVYLARVEGAVGFVKPVVIKLILPEHASDERFLRMFAREAQIVSQLRHPSVVDVLEFGEHAGAYVMVIEYVRGHHLGQWCRYLTLVKRRIPPVIAIQITSDILDALHHAHDLTHHDGSPMHIVHRDISPSNILLDEDGRARLLDFGVARMRGGSIEYQTQSKGFVGKLTYTAPEIFAGNEATRQSDLYSCAVVLHEAILGHNTFKGETQAETMKRVLMRTPEAVATGRDDVPAGLDEVLQQALAKSPADRFATALDFSQALRALLPAPESELRASLAALLKHDFGPQMAEMLGIESLAERDEAWRRLSLPPQKRTLSTFDGEDWAPLQTADGRSGRVLGARSRANESLAPPTRVQRSLRVAQQDGFDVALAEPAEARDAAADTQPVTVRPRSRDGSRSGETVPAAVLSTSADLSIEMPGAVRPALASARESRLVILSWRKLLLGVLLLGVFVAMVAVVSVSMQTSAPAPVVPRIRVVASPTAEPEPPRSPSGPFGASAARRAGSAGGGPSSPATVPHPAVAVSAAPAPEPGIPTGPNPRALTRTFRGQQGKIETCFASHARGTGLQPEVQVEFDLESSGRIRRVRILPESFATTELGRCIERVARGTKFAKQGQSVSFAIPVRASRAPR
jgi:eukaryotic-like serine/threonine-protein kinase